MRLTRTMRLVVASIFAVVLCFAGFCIAQKPEAYKTGAPPRGEILRAGGTTSPRVSPYEPTSATDSSRYPTATGLAPIVEQTPQQVAVIISKMGLRFLSSQNVDIEDVELPSDGLLVICNSAEVKTDSEGQQEVTCHAAAVVKSATFNGKASLLRYKGGKVVLESAESDSFIARNKGNTTVFMLRARKISLDLNSLQIEGSDGSVVHLKHEPAPDAISTPEATPPQTDILDQPAPPKG